MPAAVRVSLILIQILNYFLVEALFTNTTMRTGGEDCHLFDMICFDKAWVKHRVSALVMSQVLYTPALRIMYVLYVWDWVLAFA